MKIRVVDRIPTFVKGLDSKMDRGIPENYIVLIAGPAGSMKTSLTFSIMYNASKKLDKKCLYLSLEQDRNEILEHMARLNHNIKDTKNFYVIDLSSFREELGDDEKKANWTDAIISTVKRFKETYGCEIFALDSLDAFYSLVSFKNPRREIFHMFRKMKSLKMTIFLISEMGRDERRFGKFGIEEFLSDGIIHLSLKEFEMGQITTVRRYISVVKMRKTKHDTNYHPLLVSSEGFEIVGE